MAQQGGNAAPAANAQPMEEAQGEDLNKPNRPRYTAEVKAAALKLVDEGKQYRDVAKTVGPRTSCGTIAGWVKERKDEKAMKAALDVYAIAQNRRDNELDLTRPARFRMRR